VIHDIIYFWLFLKASLLSTGGSGNLPSLHNDFLARHWGTNREFAESLTIGQLSPGPSGLWVISLGYLTAGVPGSLLALVAITLPPLLVVVVQKIYQKIEGHTATEGFMLALALSVCGIFIIVLSVLLRSTGANVKSIAIAGVAVALASTRKIPIPAILASAAIAGIALTSV
jgi:chromate transporter